MVKKQTFENSIKQLEQIVLELETGDPPLEKAIKRFEEGVQLAKYCSEKLDETEKKLTVLLQDSSGAVSEKPLATESTQEP